MKRMTIIKDPNLSFGLISCVDECEKALGFVFVSQTEKRNVADENARKRVADGQVVGGTLRRVRWLRSDKFQAIGSPPFAHSAVLA